MNLDVDVVIVGSGFAGSLMALGLLRQGKRVALVERGRHPRFAIGESSTPLANLLLEEIADRYDVPHIRSFSKWGTWQQSHRDVACGLKRGFTFFFHEHGKPFGVDAAHERQLMVAASPNERIADTHWYRPDFDHALVRYAQESGAVYLDETSIARLTFSNGCPVIDATRGGHSVSIRAGFLVDASGPRGFLHRTLPLQQAPLRWLPPTVGLYSHFEQVERWDRLHDADGVPPYAPDDAALHHVFPGGWIWVLRFNNGITSAGAAMSRPLGERLHAAAGAPAWNRVLDELPAVRAQFEHARPTMPFVYAPEVAFRTDRVAGAGWALLPSAAGVIDPLLSTGFPLTLLGVLRLLEILGATTAGAERDARLRDYERLTQAELDATEQIVAALYASMNDVELFKRLSLLYFAAASYSEAARRLGKAQLAPGFLLHAHPRFGPGARSLALRALSPPTGAARAALLRDVDALIEPFDIAGLLDRTRRDWYPVLAEDVIAGASKLEATAGELETLLMRSGFPLAPRA